MLGDDPQQTPPDNEPASVTPQVPETATTKQKRRLWRATVLLIVSVLVAGGVYAPQFFSRPSLSELTGYHEKQLANLTLLDLSGKCLTQLTS
jgi:hypothetical protein